MDPNWINGSNTGRNLPTCLKAYVYEERSEEEKEERIWSMVGFPPVVFLGEDSSVPAWWGLLLLMAGDVERNPGPVEVFPCGAPQCDKRVTYRGYSVRCSQQRCQKWFHRQCSGLSIDEIKAIDRGERRGVPSAWLCATCSDLDVSPSTSSAALASIFPLTMILIPVVVQCV